VAQTITTGEQKVCLESDSLKFSATPTPQVKNPSDSDSTALLAYGGDDAREFRPLQHLSVGDLVLPADFENSAKTSEMKLLKLLFISPVNGPGFTAVEKYC